MLSLLPNATFNYKISSDQNLKTAFNRTIVRPNLYQLNPNVSIDDPYNLSKGNPLLNPEIRTAMFIEYSKKIKSNYISVRLYYDRHEQVINNLTFMNDSSAFETRIYNLGTIQQYGIQFSGTMKIGSTISFVPYLRLYDQYCAGNRLAHQYAVGNRNQFVFEQGYSANISFKHHMNLSMTLQHSSPKNNIQGNSFSDMLYFISFEKTFKKNFKTGISNGLLFTHNFTYEGSDISDQKFDSHFAGDIHIPNVLVWFNVVYQFDTGTHRGKIERQQAEVDAPPKSAL